MNNLSLVLSSPKDFLYSFHYGNKVVEIKPFERKRYLKAKQVKGEIERLCPKLQVNLIGSIGLQIEGRGDIDLYAGTRKRYLRTYYRKLEERYGPPVKVRKDYRDWEFVYQGVPVELHVTDENNSRYQKQLRLFNLIENNSQYLQHYRKIKKSFAGHTIREYVRARMSFFNQILRTEEPRQIRGN